MILVMLVGSYCNMPVIVIVNVIAVVIIMTLLVTMILMTSVSGYYNVVAIVIANVTGSDDYDCYAHCDSGGVSGW